MIKIFYPFLGDLIYRLRGSEYNIRPIGQALFAAPYGVLVGGLPGFAVWVFTTIMVCLGYGRGISLEKPNMIGEPEKIEFLIKWLQPHISVYWYKVSILSLSGLLITLPAGLLTLNPIVALSGLLKGPAYALSFKLGKGTEGGEYLTGALLWGVLSIWI